MPEYTLSSPAAVIDAAISSVAGADNTPTASSQNMVTSGGVKNYVDNQLFAAYPIGSVYMNASSGTNPATLMGFGTWVAFGAGRVLVGVDATQTEFDTGEKTGGAKTHTLTEQEIPSHRHFLGKNGSTTYTGNPRMAGLSNNGSTVYSEYTGGGQAHNNLQPYIVVYMWKRTA